MRTKLMLTAAMIISTGFAAFAQKTTFGIKGGVNFYNLTGKDVNGEKLGDKIKTGFNIGADAEIPIGVDFYIQPGLEYIMKGAHHVYRDDNKINLSYLEVPVNFLYKPDLGKGKLLLGFGPYIAFGVGGKYKPVSGNERDIKFKNDVTASEAVSGNVYFKGLDAGANFLFGYECSNKVSVQLDASLGLMDINPKLDGNQIGKSSSKNTGFGISVGYRFK